MQVERCRRWYLQKELELGLPTELDLFYSSMWFVDRNDDTFGVVDDLAMDALFERLAGRRRSWLVIHSWSTLLTQSRYVLHEGLTAALRDDFSPGECHE